ncbi:MAG: alginate export family protein [Verrucomicrobiales bacterium]|nr:alginate export family protein [Verrucomicrobiales bacterium]
MKPTTNPTRTARAFASTSTASLLLLAPTALAQYAPPPPPGPYAGLVNEALRKAEPAMAAWDFGGLARIRYEIKDGHGIQGVPGSMDFRAENVDNHNSFFIERFQLRGAYKAPWWSIYAEARSSTAQGDERFAYPNAPRHKGDGPEADLIDLHQAYFTVGNPKEFPLTLKLGRQELAYADEHFLGAFFWNNIGRVFDAAKVQWKADAFDVDFFTGRPVIPLDDSFNVSNDYETLSGFWAPSAKVPHHQLDVFFLSRNVNGDSPTAVAQPEIALPSPRDIYSIGTRLKSKPGDFGGWDYTVDAVGQFGDFRDLRAGAPARRLDHLAYAFIGNVGYSFTNAPAKPRLALEYSFGSGDSDPNDGDHGTFDNLYPTNHKFYGYADFVSLQNVHDLRPMLTVKPMPRLSVALEGHLFWLADTHDSFYNVGGAPRGGIGTTAGNGYGINPSYDSFLGGEIDLIAGYALTRYAQIEAGYCRFFTGSYIDASLANPNFGSRDGSFTYLQLMVRF